MKSVINGKRPAVFLDRDGTLIRNRHYGCDPWAIELMSGVVEGLRLLQDGGFALIVATNQGGVARGYFDERQLCAMHEKLVKLLGKYGIDISAVYYCPHHPEGTVPGYAGHCSCRKPAAGMVFRAAREHGLDLPSSWFLGDILDDIEAGQRAGCRGILIDLGTEGRPENHWRTPVYIARDVHDAASYIVKQTALKQLAAGAGQ